MKPSNEKNIQTLAIAFIESPSEITFRNLASRINWGLRKYIFNIVNDDSAVDEIMSKTLENIYFKRDQFNSEKGNFSTWMYRIAYNNSLKYLQEKAKQVKLHFSEDFEDIYDSELCKDDMSDAYVCSDLHTSDTGEIVDIVFGEKVEVYMKERVLNEIYDASVKCIDYLPENLRMVMHERLINNKKIEEIAADNNVPITSVKNWLRKGKTVLSETIREHYAALYEMYVFNQ
jgi:RNA polymerase sigma factor (sigma-70 family)